jgi:hypothetical protein
VSGGKSGIGVGVTERVKIPARVSTFSIGQSCFRLLPETRPLSYTISGTAVLSILSLLQSGVYLLFDVTGVAEVTR